MKASARCRPENLSLRNIQLEPVGAHPPGHIIDAGRHAVLKLQRCRRTAEPIDMKMPGMLILVLVLVIKDQFQALVLKT